jgi:hypothetical protein
MQSSTNSDSEMPALRLPDLIFLMVTDFIFSFMLGFL